MDDALYEETFDVIVVGTGLKESMIAASLGISGKRVLHIDANSYYGGTDASFTLNEFLEWTEKMSDSRRRSGSRNETKDTSASVSNAADMTDLPADCSYFECPQISGAHFVREMSCSNVDLHNFMKCRSIRIATQVAKDAAEGASGVASRALFLVEKASKISSRVTTAIENGETGDDVGQDAKCSLSSETPVSKDTIQEEEGEKEAKNDHQVVEAKTTCGEDGRSVDKRDASGRTSIDTFGSDTQRSLAALMGRGRRFNIDLTPRLILCNGALVNALIRSGSSRYMEYMTLQDMSVLDDASSSKGTSILKRVPSSKRDVFQCRWLSLREKRALMNFLQFCNDFAFAKSGKASDVKFQNETMLHQQRSLVRPQNKKSAAQRGRSQYDYESFRDKPFAAFLKAGGMPESLRRIATYAIALASTEADAALDPSVGDDKAALLTTETAMQQVCAYVTSLGRHGTTAFLCVDYGSGELPQSFCRLCAVNRGVYLLREPVCGIAVEPSKGPPTPGGKSKCRGIFLSSKRRFLPCAEALVIGAELLPRVYARKRGPTVVRMIAICSKPLLKGPRGKSGYDGEVASQRTLCVVLPSSGKLAVRCLQLDETVHATPAGYVLVHIWARALGFGDDEVCAASNEVKRAFSQLLEDSETTDDDVTGSREKKATVLYRVEYHHRTFLKEPRGDSRKLPANVHVCYSDVDADSVHYEDSYRAAKSIYRALRPSAVKLSKAEEEEGGFLVKPKTLVGHAGTSNDEGEWDIDVESAEGDASAVKGA